MVPHFLQAVQHFIEENPNMLKLMKQSGTFRRKKSESFSKFSFGNAYEMYKQGINLDEIAKGTWIIQDKRLKIILIRCFEDGMEVDWDSFVPARIRTTD